MRAENEIFITQFNLIRAARILIGDRAKQIDLLGKNATQEDVFTLVYKRRSLNLFNAKLEYLLYEVECENPLRHLHSFLHVRTLLDVFSHFLYLASHKVEINKFALVCLAASLRALAICGLDTEYEKSRLEYKIMFLKHGLEIPESPIELTPTWIKNNGLAFKSTRDMLTNQNIQSFSTDVIKIFPAKRMSEIYSILSEILHGNPFYNPTPYNERFWVISSCIISSAFLLELIDKFVFFKKTPAADFINWLEKTEKSIPEFSDLWKSKRQINAN